MTFDEYQKQAMTTAIATEHNLETLYYRALGLANEAGEVAGKIKKIIRDRDGKIDDEYRHMITSEMGDVLWYLQALAEFFDIPLNDLAEENLAKLASRQKRGTIHGDGDKR
ncbi:MAG TPA: nucleoside triphosphate pyrophosphohydrolase family protein [Candidatus Saccharimonadales bacterium]|nr:nucleoside triphosphate pyrophosphohydrolase family protein [Candidatus Saccharimonadales bacterium]